MTNMTIQPLWLTHFNKILLVLEFQLTKFIFGAFSYKAHFRPQISSNVYLFLILSAHKSVLKEIWSLQWNFLWSGREVKAKFSLVS